MQSLCNLSIKIKVGKRGDRSLLEIVKMGENTIHDSSFEVDRPNGHKVYLLLLVKTPAKFLVHDKWEDITPDMAVIFKPGQKHRYMAAAEHYTDCWIHISADRLPLGEHFPFGEPLKMHGAQDYYSLFHLIANEYYKMSPHKDMLLRDLTSVLIRKIADESDTKEYPDIYYQLADVRKQIYMRPEKEWAVAEIAAHLNISVGYFHNIYKKYFGVTCINDVIQSRIQYACELLVSNEMSVETIAGMCGYRNTEHFIRQFKRVMDISPKQYRKSQNKSISD